MNVISHALKAKKYMSSRTHAWLGSDSACGRKCPHGQVRLQANTFVNRQESFKGSDLRIELLICLELTVKKILILISFASFIGYATFSAASTSVKSSVRVHQVQLAAADNI